MEHIVLPMDTTLRCLEAPLTEVARITFSDKASLEKAKAVVDKYVVYANREGTLPVAATFGQTVDLENVGEMKLIFVVGWKAAEVSSSLSIFRTCCLQGSRFRDSRIRTFSRIPTKSKNMSRR